MNKLTLAGIITTVIMLGATWISVGGSKGGLNDDIVNILAVAGAVALVIITVFVVIKYVRQMQTDTASGKLADENWDGIGEYKNELPAGWAIMFLGLIIWGMWYFIAGYPVNAYSQIGEYNEDTAAHNAKFEAKYANMDAATLVEMGESVFLAECKVCHGLTADGIDGKAANLNQRLETVVVKDVLVNGSNNKLLGFEFPMPTGADLGLSAADIDEISAYVGNGLKGTEPAMFGVCAGCHGASGEGMDGVGPQINGFNNALVTNVLTHGKKGAIGTMPKFADRLNAKQIEAASAYVTSLSK
ncbi:MAG: cbb3-type cytochrome c oxidase N-terminal domain-containing protein [Campylobacterota bacterium]